MPSRSCRRSGRQLHAMNADPALAHRAEDTSFAVGVGERVAEMHDTFRVRAVSEPQGVPEFVHSLLEGGHCQTNAASGGPG